MECLLSVPLHHCLHVFTFIFISFFSFCPFGCISFQTHLHNGTKFAYSFLYLHNYDNVIISVCNSDQLSTYMYHLMLLKTFNHLNITSFIPYVCEGWDTHPYCLNIGHSFSQMEKSIVEIIGEFLEICQNFTKKW